MIPAPLYFKGIGERDVSWVLTNLTHFYAGWADAYPALFSAKALKDRLDDKISRVIEKIATLTDAHYIVDGKRFLKPAFLNEVPASLRGYFLSLLAEEASQNPPEDLRVLVKDRILARWRIARAAFKA